MIYYKNKMFSNYPSDYINLPFNYINKVTFTEPEQINNPPQEEIPYIFSPLNYNMNILELSSLNNYTNTNSFYNVKVKKLPSYTNKGIISTNSGKKTLVLDLDETLVHSSTQKPFPNKRNIVIHLKIKNIPYTIYVILRPFLQTFLKELSLYYDLYIFTASMGQYANTLINYIDKNKVIIQVLNRNNCRYIKGVFLKDLSIFKKDFKDIIIIDNNPVSYSLNKNNGIPIRTWIDDPKDKELLKFIPILKLLSKVKDVRPFIKRIVNKSKTNLDFSKVNTLLNINKRLNHNLAQSMIIKFPKKKINSDNNKMNNTYKSVINQDLIKRVKTINFNSVIQNLNKSNLIKKLHLKDIKSIPSQSIIIKNNNKKPLRKVKISSIKRYNNTYNISIENINNIQNKINIINNTDIQDKEKQFNTNLDYPRKKTSKKIKPNINTFSIKPILSVKNTKNINKNLFKKINSNQINTNKKDNVFNGEKANMFIKTEEDQKHPTDNIRNHLNKYLSIGKGNIIYRRMFPENIYNNNEESIKISQKNENNSFNPKKMTIYQLKQKNIDFNNNKRDVSSDFKLNETLKTGNNNYARIVVMKILSKPKKIVADSSKIRINNDTNFRVTKILKKPNYERPAFDKYPTEQIRYNRKRIIDFQNI